MINFKQNTESPRFRLSLSLYIYISIYPSIYLLVFPTTRHAGAWPHLDPYAYTYACINQDNITPSLVLECVDIELGLDYNVVWRYDRKYGWEDRPRGRRGGED